MLALLEHKPCNNTSDTPFFAVDLSQKDVPFWSFLLDLMLTLGDTISSGTQARPPKLSLGQDRLIIKPRARLDQGLISASAEHDETGFPKGLGAHASANNALSSKAHRLIWRGKAMLAEDIFMLRLLFRHLLW